MTAIRKPLITRYVTGDLLRNDQRTVFEGENYVETANTAGSTRERTNAVVNVVTAQTTSYNLNKCAVTMYPHYGVEPPVDDSDFNG